MIFEKQTIKSQKIVISLIPLCMLNDKDLGEVYHLAVEKFGHSIFIHHFFSPKIIVL